MTDISVEEIRKMSNAVIAELEAEQAQLERKLDNLMKVSVSESDEKSKTDSKLGREIDHVGGELQKILYTLLNVKLVHNNLADVVDSKNKGINEYSWQYYINKLNDNPDFRKEESQKAALLEQAQINAKGKMEELHTYSDGEVDHPLLTPELVIRLQEEEAAAKKPKKKVRKRRTANV